MNNLLKPRRSQQPFLAPLGSQPLTRRLREVFDRLPAAAAPIAVTLIGGIALFVGLAAYLGRDAGSAPTQQASAAIEEPAPVAPQAPPVDETEATPSSQSTEETRTAGNETEPAATENESDTAAADAAPAVNSSADWLLQPPAQSSGEIIPIQPDPSETAGIAPSTPEVGSLEPIVPVAENEDEIAALEAIQQQEAGIDPDAPSAAPSTGAQAAGPMSTATANRYVNMRAGPSDDADVLLVVPALAEIQAEAGCDWCAVSYDGQEGFIYKTFISYDENQSAPEASSGE